MFACLSPLQQTVPFGCGIWYFSVWGQQVSPLSSGTTVGLDGLGSGGSGVLESCQCFSKQPGWPVPQDHLLPLPKTGSLSVSALEESSPLPPTLLPSTACLHIYDCGL